jgi:formylglycine-generating enzyme required for sulfatase activity
VADLISCQFGSLFNQYMWWCGNSGSTLHPVAGKLGNDYGLYDMHGNVWEWCQDWHHMDYTGAPTDGRAWESPTSNYRVFRGGSGYAAFCRSAARFNHGHPNFRGVDPGCRLVRAASP